MPILLMLGLVLTAICTPGHAAPPQQRRLYHPCRTCTTPTAPSPRAVPMPLPDATESAEEEALPTLTDSEDQPFIVAAAESEEAQEPSDPVSPLETIGAVLILLFLAIEGMRWRKDRRGARMTRMR